MYFIDKHSDLFDETIRIVIIGFQKGSGKWLEVREKSVKSQGILKWILSGNPAEMSEPKRPRPKFLWPKCPTFV